MDANVRHIVREVIEGYLAEHLPGLLEVAERRKQDELLEEESKREYEKWKQAGESLHEPRPSKLS